MKVPLNTAEKKILRHMLGAEAHQQKKDWGYRNRFCAVPDTKEYETLLELEGKGLAWRSEESGSHLRVFTESQGIVHNEEFHFIYFHATKQGCKAIGFTKKQIERTFEP